MSKFTSIAAALKTPGEYSLGNNLYLLVSSETAASWMLRYRSNQNRIRLGLGSATGVGAPKVTREQARRKANQMLGQLVEGVDLRADRRRARVGDSFGQLFDRMLAEKVPAKSHAQWKASMRDYAAKLLPMRVVNITQDDVLGLLRPAWGSETASRVQDRIERVLQMAVAEGLIETNVARWKGHLQYLLGAKPVKKGKEGHAALPVEQVPALIARLQAPGQRGVGMGSQALVFCILTATRAGEALYARKSEIDRAERTWTIPAERMKAGVTHIVPLSTQAMAMVDALWDAPSDFLFANEGKKLGETALNDKLCKPANRGGLGLQGTATVHGFRSTFSDFIADRTSIDAETREHCLAHQLDAVTGAYRRKTAVEKRRVAMQVWANACHGISAVVSYQLAA